MLLYYICNTQTQNIQKMDFNTANFKAWRKKGLTAADPVLYQAYQDEATNRVIVYDSADKMIEQFNGSFQEFGGTGAWKLSGNNHTSFDLKKKDSWRLGEDFPTLQETNEALEMGTTAAKYLGKVEKAKETLMQRFPALKELSEVAVSKRRRRRFSEDGDELCIDRYMTGDPAMFMSMPKQDIKKKSCRIYIDIAISAMTDAEYITTNIIYSLALAEIVSMAGINLEILVGATSRGATSDAARTCVCCFAKRADEALDTARLLSFALPGVFRQYMFGSWGNLTNGKAAGGLGAVGKDFSGMAAILDFLKVDIKIKGGDAAFGTTGIQAVIQDIKDLFNMGVQA